MKALIAVLIMITNTALAQTQLQLPDPSPRSKIIQPVGYTSLTVAYGRPSARQRKIMGELVPYKKLWRTGGGKCSTIQLKDEVTINNKKIPPGIYAIVTIPDEHEWTVMLNTDTSKVYGDPSEYNITHEVVRMQVIPETTSRFYESLTIDLDVINHSANFFLSWENTQIHFMINTHSHAKALTEINNALQSNGHDTDVLLNAAYYYTTNHESLDQALQWINKAITIKEDRWAYAQKIDVLEKMKNYREAKKTSEAAIAFLRKTKPQEYQSTIENFKNRMQQWQKLN